jgi:hypothetical protein
MKRFYPAAENPGFHPGTTAVIRFVKLKPSAPCQQCGRKIRSGWTMLVPFQAGTLQAFSVQLGAELPAGAVVCSDHPLHVVERLQAIVTCDQVAVGMIGAGDLPELLAGLFRCFPSGTQPCAECRGAHAVWTMVIPFHVGAVVDGQVRLGKEHEAGAPICAAHQGLQPAERLKDLVFCGEAP